ncbi:MAG: hypothetical protein ABIE14_03430 [Patescibacteria group bacterium]
MSETLNAKSDYLRRMNLNSVLYTEINRAETWKEKMVIFREVFRRIFFKNLPLKKLTTGDKIQIHIEEMVGKTITTVDDGRF